ncbi:glycoside hydrolase superfamily [Xylariaceae sp. FL0016]|nr:glycoside hydrolase superfamily [Xylariaceae sp. FL0016]
MMRRRAFGAGVLSLLSVFAPTAESADCEMATTTIYLPTTIYASAPSATSETDGGQGSYCSMSSSPGLSNPSLTTTTTTAAVTTTPTVVTSVGNFSITSTGSLETSTQFPQPTSISGPRPPPSPPAPFRGFKNAVYFTNWGSFRPQELPVSELTHVLYAFGDITLNGTVVSSDPKADVETRYALDHSPWDFGKNAYGAVKQMFIHKKRNRNLKVLLSIGGWNYSPKFAAATATAMGRQNFAKSAVKLVTDWGFDGIDVDWEYPTNDAEKENLVQLLAACRKEFDNYSFRHKLWYHFLITVASPASAINYRYMDLTAMDKYLDMWHLMAYDYSGSWDTTTAHQANVFADAANALATKFSTDNAVSEYESKGISAAKIIVGLPLYGRSFEATAGLGQNYTGVGEGGPQPGVWLYKDLPKKGAQALYDNVAKATYSYDAATRELISYDDVRSTVYKAQWLAGRHLGGAYFWEASGDRKGALSLINTMSKKLHWLDRTPNNLRYPTSQYNNIRMGLPGVF